MDVGRRAVADSGYVYGDHSRAALPGPHPARVAPPGPPGRLVQRAAALRRPGARPLRSQAGEHQRLNHNAVRARTLGRDPLRSQAGEHQRLNHNAVRARNVRQESKPWEGSVESTAIFSIASWFLQDVVLEKNDIVVLFSNHVNI